VATETKRGGREGRREGGREGGRGECGCDGEKRFDLRPSRTALSRGAEGGRGGREGGGEGGRRTPIRVPAWVVCWRRVQSDAAQGIVITEGRAITRDVDGLAVPNGGFHLELDPGELTGFDHVAAACCGDGGVVVLLVLVLLPSLLGARCCFCCCSYCC